MPVFKRTDGTPAGPELTLVVGNSLRLKLDGLPKNAASMTHFELRSSTPSVLEVMQKADAGQREQNITLTAKASFDKVTVRAYNASGAAADCSDSAVCVPPLQIVIKAPLSAHDLSENQDILFRLLLAETPNPSHARYVSNEEAKRAMQYMRIVVENRLAAARDSAVLAKYVASGPKTLDFKGIITARQHGVQFDGFESYPSIGGSQRQTIDECIRIANSGTHRQFEAFRLHVEAALEVARGEDLSGTIAMPRTLYYWRTAGSGAPSRHAVKELTLGGQEFYSLTEDFLKNPNNPGAGGSGR